MCAVCTTLKLDDSVFLKRIPCEKRSCLRILLNAHRVNVMCSVYMLLAIALTHIHRLHQFVIRIFCYCVTFFCIDRCRLSNNFQCEIHAISMQHQVAHDFRIICTFFTCTPGFILNIFVEPFAVWMKCVTGILVKAFASTAGTHILLASHSVHISFLISAWDCLESFHWHFTWCAVALKKTHIFSHPLFWNS